MKMGTTDDRRMPHLGGLPDEEPTPQASDYQVLSEQERVGFVRPLRYSIYHLSCDTVTMMRRDIAETVAHNPQYYSLAYCMHCQKHRYISEFVWMGTDGTFTNEVLGS
jgi:hypothetical protein